MKLSYKQILTLGLMLTSGTILPAHSLSNWIAQQAAKATLSTAEQLVGTTVKTMANNKKKTLLGTLGATIFYKSLPRRSRLKRTIKNCLTAAKYGIPAYLLYKHFTTNDQLAALQEGQQAIRKNLQGLSRGQENLQAGQSRLGEAQNRVEDRQIDAAKERELIGIRQQVAQQKLNELSKQQERFLIGQRAFKALLNVLKKQHRENHIQLLQTIGQNRLLYARLMLACGQYVQSRFDRLEQNQNDLLRGQEAMPQAIVAAVQQALANNPQIQPSQQNNLLR